MTAKEEFRKRETSINQSLLALQEHLRRFTEAFEKTNQKNWAYVGSLGYIEQALKELVEFIRL